MIKIPFDTGAYILYNGKRVRLLKYQSALLPPTFEFMGRNWVARPGALVTTFREERDTNDA